jgi:putative endonuclease
VRTTSQRLGDAAEAFVADRLTADGWQVLARQVRVGRAEVDLLAVDPSQPATLVAVEVRWRARRDFGLPEETVDRRKLARVRAAALSLRSAGKLPDGTAVPALSMRVDLVVVEPFGRVRHHRHVG